MVADRFPALSETFILNQITGLLDRGHEVDIFATNPLPEAVSHPDVERYGLRSRTREVVYPRNLFLRGVKAAVLLAGHGSRRPALWRTINVARFGRAALGFRILHTAVPFLKPYDVVHCQYGTNGEAVGAVLKELGLQRTLVTTFHRYDLRVAERDGRAYPRLLARGDCFLAISDYSRRWMVRFGVDPAKIVLHPVGFDGRMFPSPVLRTPDPTREVVAVTVARLVPQKALHTGIHAVSRLLRDHPDLRLRYEIVGGGPLLEELAALIRSLGLDGVVHLHGPLSQDGVRDALRRSDLFILPSEDEVLPVALMEAHAAGLPAIATRVAATDEIVLHGRSGFLIPPGDMDALAAQLKILIEHPSLRVQMGAEGRRHVLAHFDVNVLNDRLVEIYRDAMRTSSPSGVH